MLLSFLKHYMKILFTWMAAVLGPLDPNCTPVLSRGQMRAMAIVPVVTWLTSEYAKSYPAPRRGRCIWWLPEASHAPQPTQVYDGARTMFVRSPRAMSG